MTKLEQDIQEATIQLDEGAITFREWLNKVVLVYYDDPRRELISMLKSLHSIEDKLEKEIGEEDSRLARIIINRFVDETK